MLTSTGTVSEAISVFPKPGRGSPSRSVLQNSPVKPSTSSTEGRSPTSTQSPSTMHPSPGRAHRGTSDFTSNSNSTGGKDNTLYHSHRSTNSSHHYSHHHGSAHHYHYRDNVGHTGTDFSSHSTHGSLLNPTHHHAYNTNYHSYTTYHHGDGYGASMRVINSTQQLRDFLLTQWRQFESGLGTSINPRSITVRNVSINGSSNSPGTPPPSSTTPPCCTPTPTYPPGPGNDRSTPTGPQFSQPPGSPVTSEHSGSLPRRLSNAVLETAACVSAENVHTLAGSGYRNKSHGGSRGGFTGSLARHGSSDVSTWQRGQATSRKNSSPTVFANRGPLNFSSTRPMVPQGSTTSSVSINAAPSAVVSSGRNVEATGLTTSPTTTATISTSDQLATSGANSNNNNENIISGSSSVVKQVIIDSKAPDTLLAPRAESPTVPVHVKPSTTASPIRARPQTADAGARRIRGGKPTEPAGSRKPTLIPARSTENVPSPVDTNSPGSRSDSKEQIDLSTVPQTRIQSTKDNRTGDDSASTVPSISPSVNAVEESMSLVSTPNPIATVSVGCTPTEHNPSPVQDIVNSVTGGDVQLSGMDKSATVVMSVNVTSGPPGSPRSPNRADTPTANGEHYWTPDPPASPSNGSVPAPDSVSANPVSNIVPTAAEVFSNNCSDQSNPTPVSSNVANEDVQCSSRARLESLNDVD